MTDRPDIPEEAVEDYQASLKSQGMRVHHSAETTRLALQAAAPAIRKQGAEEAEKRVEALNAEFDEATQELAVELADSRQSEDALLKQGAEEERERLRRVIPKAEFDRALNAVARNTPAPSEPREESR